LNEKLPPTFQNEEQERQMEPLTGPNSVNENVIRTLRNALPEMTSTECQAVAKVLPMEQVQVTKPPTSGLIMAKARDSFKTEFFLGEVLVTRTEVTYGGHASRATLMGNCPEAALIAAVLQVLSDGDANDIVAAAGRAAAPAVERISARQRNESAMVAATRVRFETMAEEEPLS
jgi:phosphonate C-P lyase system protein PhnG